MKWHAKLFITLMGIATLIYFFGPDVHEMEHDHDEREVAQHHDDDRHDDDHEDGHDHDEHEDEHSHDHDDDHKVAHYEIIEPKDVADAQNILKERTAKISEVIAKESLDNNDLEKIHEHTYSLEAAVDKLRAEKVYSSEEAIDNVDEAVQALHYGSEKHEEATSREWFGKLKDALAKL